MDTEEKTLQSYTPVAGAVEGVGRMPMPVAESTRHPPERETDTPGGTTRKEAYERETEPLGKGKQK